MVPGIGRKRFVLDPCLMCDVEAYSPMFFSFEVGLLWRHGRND